MNRKPIHDLACRQLKNLLEEPGGTHNMVTHAYMWGLGDKLLKRFYELLKEIYYLCYSKGNSYPSLSVKMRTKTRV